MQASLKVFIFIATFYIINGKNENILLHFKIGFCNLCFSYNIFAEVVLSCNYRPGRIEKFINESDINTTANITATTATKPTVSLYHYALFI